MFNSWPQLTTLVPTAPMIVLEWLQHGIRPIPEIGSAQQLFRDLSLDQAVRRMNLILHRSEGPLQVVLPALPATPPGSKGEQPRENPVFVQVDDHASGQQLHHHFHHISSLLKRLPVLSTDWVDRRYYGLFVTSYSVTRTDYLCDAMDSYWGAT
jgi:hypothetical protein